MAVEESKILIGTRRWVAYDKEELVGVYDSFDEACTYLNLHLLKKTLKDVRDTKSKPD